jgi:ribonuclease Z
VAKIAADIEDYHTAPELAAESAARARVKALALTHIVPPLRVPGLEGVFLGDAATRFDGELWIAADGDLVSLAPGGGMTRSRLGGTR